MPRLCTSLRNVLLALATAVALTPSALAGTQVEEYLAPSVVAGLARSIADNPAPADYANRPQVAPWIAQMSPRLVWRFSDEHDRRNFLATVHYEAARAGLDPQLVLAVIHHESGFKKYAISIASARGYMQVMPFWTRQIGFPAAHLFDTPDQ